MCYTRSHDTSPLALCILCQIPCVPIRSFRSSTAFTPFGRRIFFCQTKPFFTLAKRPEPRRRSHARRRCERDERRSEGSTAPWRGCAAATHGTLPLASCAKYRALPSASFLGQPCFFREANPFLTSVQSLSVEPIVQHQTVPTSALAHADHPHYRGAWHTDVVRTGPIGIEARVLHWQSSPVKSRSTACNNTWWPAHSRTLDEKPTATY